ncbi:MAG: hypothetical protein ABR884_03850 [Minisyncoccia bacterium]
MSRGGMMTSQDPQNEEAEHYILLSNSRGESIIDVEAPNAAEKAVLAALDQGPQEADPNQLIY